MAVRHFHRSTIPTLVCTATQRITDRQMAFKPKFISFDCYGTLINFEMGPAAKALVRGSRSGRSDACFPRQLSSLSPRRSTGRVEALFRRRGELHSAGVQGAWRGISGSGCSRAVRRDPDLATSPERGRGAGGDRSALPAGDPLELDGRSDPGQRRPSQGAVSRRLHRRGGARVQAAAADVRIHVRPARLRAGSDDARLVELPIRPDDAPPTWASWPRRSSIAVTNRRPTTMASAG